MGAASFVNLIFQIYSYLILARVLMSWLGPETRSPLIDILFAVTEPVLGPCRELMFSLMRLLGANPQAMMIDFSPIIAFIILNNVIRPAAMILVSMIF